METVQLQIYLARVIDTLLLPSGNFPIVSQCGLVHLIIVAERLATRTPMWACLTDTLQKELLR